MNKSKQTGTISMVDDLLWEFEIEPSAERTHDGLPRRDTQWMPLQKGHTMDALVQETHNDTLCRRDTEWILVWKTGRTME